MSNYRKGDELLVLYRGEKHKVTVLSFFHRSSSYLVQFESGLTDVVFDFQIQ